MISEKISAQKALAQMRYAIANASYVNLILNVCIKRSHNLSNQPQMTAIQSISTNTSFGNRDTSTQARAGAVSSGKYFA